MSNIDKHLEKWREENSDIFGKDNKRKWFNFNLVKQVLSTNWLKNKIFTVIKFLASLIVLIIMIMPLVNIYLGYFWLNEAMSFILFLIGFVICWIISKIR